MANACKTGFRNIRVQMRSPSKELNCKDCQQISEKHLTPVLGLLGEPDCVLQQDGALIQTRQNSISPEYYQCLAISPDQDPTENMLGKLARKWELIFFVEAAYNSN
ncbi:hypothetical protein AVEN_143664-1 [Araneus ventricosus]|uniref:Uncharacterized protein n=1 Tax=Araneus ventricosus TaxID=182803 RepID=A0A4Y2ANQ5_ARAVE|nr:hypothetical protein AVEN_143664-1 [Araneus ventricosus]